MIMVDQDLIRHDLAQCLTLSCPPSVRNWQQEPLEENVEICVKYLERMAKISCGLETCLQGRCFALLSTA